MITSIYSELPFLFGEGPLAVHVWHGLTEPDAAGESSGHFELIQSWLPQPLAKEVERSRPRKRRHKSEKSSSSSESHADDRKPDKSSRTRTRKTAAISSEATASHATNEKSHSSSAAGTGKKAILPSTGAAASSIIPIEVATCAPANVRQHIDEPSSVAAVSSILPSESATSTPASVCQHIDDATPSRPSRPSAWIPSALYKLFEDYDEPVKADAAETRSRPSALRRTREDLAWAAWMEARLVEEDPRKAEEDKAMQKPSQDSDILDERDDAIEDLWEDFQEAERRSQTVEITVARPTKGDRILVLQQTYLGLILAGSKELEIRGTRLKPQRIWLGNQGLISGEACIVEAREILSDTEWQQLWPQHHWRCAERPYKRTFAMRLADVKRCSRPWRYTHPRGAVGIVRYQPAAHQQIADNSQSAKARTGETATPKNQGEHECAPHSGKRSALEQPISESPTGGGFRV